MKRKYAAMVLGLTMALTSVNMAYAASDTAETTEAAAEDESADSTDTTTDEAEATEVYGEVTEVGEDSITINVGTPKEGQQPDGQDLRTRMEKAKELLENTTMKNYEIAAVPSACTMTVTGLPWNFAIPPITALSSP